MEKGKVGARNNQTDLCVRGMERMNHKRCLVCCRFVCSRCLTRAAGLILERRKALSGAVSLLCVFIPKQGEREVEVGKDDLLPACMI